MPVEGQATGMQTLNAKTPSGRRFIKHLVLVQPISGDVLCILS